MHIEIIPSDGTPIYRQICNQIKYLIASGKLARGKELPPIRTLAERLSVTPNTVVKAYDELEAEGLVRKRRGAGTFVTEANSPLTRKEQRRIVEQRVDSLLAEAGQLNFGLEEVVKLVRQRHATMTKSSSRPADGGAYHVG